MAPQRRREPQRAAEKNRLETGPPLQPGYPAQRGWTGSPRLCGDAAAGSIQNRLILASQSPRRQELLRLLGCPFEVIPSGVDEAAAPAGLAPARLALWLAEEKARDVAERYPDAVVIGADTIVVSADEVMGKPADRDDARRMLRALSGLTHRVITGIAVRRAWPPLLLSEAVETEVTFRPLTDNEIEAYLLTGEPMDKAGAYAIQGYGALLAAGIRGDYPNIVGLPVARLAELLRSVGFRILGEPPG